MSRNNSTSNRLKSGLVNETKRLYVDSSYSGKSHLECSIRWQKWDTMLGVPAMIASGILSGSAAVAAVMESNPYITALLAGIAAVLTGLRTFLQTEYKVSAHGSKGNQYLVLRNESRMFLEVGVYSGQTDDQMIREVRELRQRYDALNSSDPQVVGRSDYEAAKRNITSGESSYENDPLWKELEKNA